MYSAIPRYINNTAVMQDTLLGESIQTRTQEINGPKLYAIFASVRACFSGASHFPSRAIRNIKLALTNKRAGAYNFQIPLKRSNFWIPLSVSTRCESFLASRERSQKLPQQSTENRSVGPLPREAPPPGSTFYIPEEGQTGDSPSLALPLCARARASAHVCVGE